MTHTHTPRLVTGGHLVGETFFVEGTIEEVCGNDSLPFLACEGNWAAVNALREEGYTIDDAPFYYGKINGLGYILAEKDLEEEA